MNRLVHPSLYTGARFQGITDCFGGVYGIYLKFIEEPWKITTCNSETWGFWPIKSNTLLGCLVHCFILLLTNMQGDWDPNLSSFVSIPFEVVVTLGWVLSRYGSRREGVIVYERTSHPTNINTWAPIALLLIDLKWPRAHNSKDFTNWSWCQIN